MSIVIVDIDHNVVDCPFPPPQFPKHDTRTLIHKLAKIIRPTVFIADSIHQVICLFVFVFVFVCLFVCCLNVVCYFCSNLLSLALLF